MREIAYLPVADVDLAIAALGAHENAMLLAGGTNVVDYLRAGVINPPVLIDISAVPLTGVHAGEAASPSALWPGCATSPPTPECAPSSRW